MLNNCHRHCGRTIFYGLVCIDTLVIFNTATCLFSLTIHCITFLGQWPKFLVRGEIYLAKQVTVIGGLGVCPQKKCSNSNIGLTFIYLGSKCDYGCEVLNNRTNHRYYLILDNELVLAGSLVRQFMLQHI